MALPIGVAGEAWARALSVRARGRNGGSMRRSGSGAEAALLAARMYVLVAPAPDENPRFPP